MYKYEDEENLIEHGICKKNINIRTMWVQVMTLTIWEGIFPNVQKKKYDHWSHSTNSATNLRRKPWTFSYDPTKVREYHTLYIASA